MDILYGFSGAIANFVVWISHFFPSVSDRATYRKNNPSVGVYSTYLSSPGWGRFKYFCLHVRRKICIDWENK